MALSEKDKEKIKDILYKCADKEAEVIIDFTDSMVSSMPSTEEAMKAWAEKQAKAFADARTEITKRFTEELKAKMSADK